MFSLFFLGSCWLFASVACINVPLVEFVTLENPAPNAVRPWFAGTTPSLVEHYRSSGWTVQTSNGRVGFMTPDMSDVAKSGCGEINLVEVHEIVDENDKPALSTLSKEAIEAAGMEYRSKAGYLARSLVCGAMAHAIFELRSLTKNQTFYIVGRDQYEKYVSTSTMEVYATRVLGYPFYIQPPPLAAQVSFETGAIVPSAYDNKMAVKMSTIHRMEHKHQYYGTFTSLARLEELKKKYAWAVVPSPSASIYSDEEGDCSALKSCGKMLRLIEVFDNVNVRQYLLPHHEWPNRPNGVGWIRTFGYCPIEYNGCGAQIPFIEHYNAAKKNYAYSMGAADEANLKKQGYIVKRHICYLKSATNWDWVPTNTCT